VNRILKKLVTYFSEKQKTLFLVDSIGAFITAFILFVIVRPLNEYFGIPIKELTYLSVIAFVFCIYSATCFLFLKDSFTTFIKFIGIANLMYCTLTIGLMIKYYPLLTIIGTSYFLIEIAIICGLSYLELTVSTRNREK
jgi:hypothetical protein